MLMFRGMWEKPLFDFLLFKFWFRFHVSHKVSWAKSLVDSETQTIPMFYMDLGINS